MQDSQLHSRFQALTCLTHLQGFPLVVTYKGLKTSTAQPLEDQLQTMVNQVPVLLSKFNFNCILHEITSISFYQAPPSMRFSIYLSLADAAS